MRSTSRHIVGGFAAGLFTAVALSAMLGFRQQAPAAPKLHPRTEALIRDIKNAEDALAEAETQVKFWASENVSQDSEVSRLTADTDPSTCGPFFLDRAKGLSNRAAHSALDARLRQALCSRKVQALKADLVSP